MAKKTKKTGPRWGLEFPWKRENYLLLFLGIAVIVVGFISLSIGPVDSIWSMDIAPILLFLGYCVILPVAILYRKKEKLTVAEGSAVSKWLIMLGEWAISSAGLERLPYTQEVIGSNPISPTGWSVSCGALQEAPVAWLPNDNSIKGAVAQLVRVPACHAGCREFESRQPRINDINPPISVGFFI